jgi:hypothetical protein
MYLAPHLDELYSLIRRRAIIQYCAPYVTTDIRIMAGVFRTSAEEVSCLQDEPKKRTFAFFGENFSKITLRRARNGSDLSKMFRQYNLVKI